VQPSLPNSRRIRANILVLAAALAGLAAPLRAQTAADSTAVKRAALDYIEGFYEGDSTKLVRAVRPEVFKYGFSRPRDSTTYQGMQMKWPEFHAFANRVKASGRPAPASAPKGVQLLDVLDQTAAVKVTAWWGTDYLLMGKYDGKWMIAHVMWQSPGR
jgi:hypothetical protein